MKKAVLSICVSAAFFLASHNVAQADEAAAHNQKIDERLKGVMESQDFNPDAEYPATSRVSQRKPSLHRVLSGICKIMQVEAFVHVAQIKNKAGEIYDRKRYSQAENEKRTIQEGFLSDLKNITDIGFSKNSQNRMIERVGERVQAEINQLQASGHLPDKFDCVKVTESMLAVYSPKLASYEEKRAETLSDFVRNPDNRQLVEKDWLSEGGIGFLGVMAKPIDPKSICIWEDGINQDILITIKDKLPKNFRDGVQEGRWIKSILDLSSHLANIKGSKASWGDPEPFDPSTCSLAIGTKAGLVNIKKYFEDVLKVNVILYSSGISEVDLQEAKLAREADRKSWEAKISALAAERTKDDQGVKMTKLEGVWAGKCNPEYDTTYQIFEVKDNKRWYTMCPSGKPSWNKKGCLSSVEVAEYHEGMNLIKMNLADGSEQDFMLKDINTMVLWYSKADDRVMFENGMVSWGPIKGRESPKLYRCM